MLSPKGPDTYDFTPETKKKIWQEIMRRWPHMTCPLCQGRQWELADGIVDLPLLSNYWLGKRLSGLPNAAMICATCGHTMLFNLIALGLQELVGPDMEDVRKRWGLK